MTLRIVTHYDPKPIPMRGMDWTAHADDYEPGDLVGCGATEQEAINDLLEQIERAAV